MAEPPEEVLPDPLVCATGLGVAAGAEGAAEEASGTGAGGAGGD